MAKQHSRAERDSCPEGHRPCSRCTKMLPLTDFSPIPQGYMHRRSICKECIWPTKTPTTPPEILPPNTKRCRACKEVLELSYFHKASQSHDGRNSRCKSCRSEAGSPERKQRNVKYSSALYSDPQKHKQYLERQRQWREANRDRVNAKQRAWVAANRERYNASKRAWYHRKQSAIAESSKHHASSPE